MSIMNRSNIPNDSLKKRYIFKLSSSIVSIPIQMLAAALIPRILGPGNYGNFQYILFSIKKIISFLSTGDKYFVTRLSENINDEGLKKFYWNLVGLLLFLITLVFFISSFLGIHDFILPGQDLIYIWMALILLFSDYIYTLMRKMIDIYGLTVKGEIVFIISKIPAIIVLLIFFILDRHKMSDVFFYRFCISVITIAGCVLIFKKNNISMYPKTFSETEKKYGYLKSFTEYSHPLYTFAIVGLLTEYIRRWLLQVYGGSIEQGYFSLSLAISAFVMMFSDALTPLLLREFSFHRGNQDTEKMTLLFKQFVPMFYSIAAYFSIFIMLQSFIITNIFGGSEFMKARLPIAIMALYPIHYTTNNILYALFFSTRQTSLHRNLGIFFRVFGLLLTFFLIAPSEYYGLEAGAVGYSLSMILVTFLTYNIYLWFSTKILNIQFVNIFLHQFKSVLFFLIIGLISINLTEFIFDSMIPSFILSGIIYTILTIAATHFSPFLFNFQLNEIYNRLKTR